MKILLVEDEIILRRVLESRFVHEGFEVLTAGNGTVAITKALEEKPDAIMLDVLIPEPDGIEVFKHIRNDPWGKNVPIYFLTVLHSDIIYEAMLRDGNTEYMIKTAWTLKKIVDKVKTEIEWKKLNK